MHQGRCDVPRPADGELAAGLGEPALTQRRATGDVSHVFADPRAARRLALQADVVEDGGGPGEMGGEPCEHSRRYEYVRRGCHEQPGLDSERQPGQLDGADLSPVRAVSRLVPGERVT